MFQNGSCFPWSENWSRVRFTAVLDYVSAIDRMISEFEAELEVEAGERLRKDDLKEGMEPDSAWVKHVGVRDLSIWASSASTSHRASETTASGMQRASGGHARIGRDASKCGAGVQPMPQLDLLRRSEHGNDHAV